MKRIQWMGAIASLVLLGMGALSTAATAAAPAEAPVVISDAPAVVQAPASGIEEPLFLTSQGQCLASCLRDYNACVAGCGGNTACEDACFEADLTCQVQRCHFNS